MPAFKEMQNDSKCEVIDEFILDLPHTHTHTPPSGQWERVSWVR